MYVLYEINLVNFFFQATLFDTTPCAGGGEESPKGCVVDICQVRSNVYVRVCCFGWCCCVWILSLKYWWPFCVKKKKSFYSAFFLWAGGVCVWYMGKWINVGMQWVVVLAAVKNNYKNSVCCGRCTF